jgi:hypothetical protein
VNKYLCLIAVMACIFSNQINAQALWGAEASTGQGDGQFDTNFFLAVDSNSLANIGWSALTVYDSSGGNMPGNAYWSRNLLGYSEGAYWSDTNPVASPSQANGIAIFDSDYMDNNGIAGNFGQGVSPSAHRGELISPPIDLSGYTDESIMLKFYSLYRNFQIDELSIAASTDNGTSWGPAVDYRTYQADVSEGFVYVPFPAGTLAGVINLTQVRIKFIFEGDYYFALVDDVTVMINDIVFRNGFDN